MSRLLAAVTLGAVLLAVVLAGAPGAGAADGPSLTYACDPPLPPSAANCSIWHNSPVTLNLVYGDAVPAPVLGSDCASPHVVNTDTAGLGVMCAVWDVKSHKITNDTATIKVDTTPPSVTGFTPARPPDHDGWWNRPVSLAFAGTDATSGISGCDTVTYSGPDGVAAEVTGACRDVAGNSAARSLALKYDATPPTLTPLTPKVADSQVTLNWATSPDAVLTEIRRSPGIGDAPASMVYSGSGRSFTDPVVMNNTTYNYSISSSDAAANSASTVVVVTPRSDSTQPGEVKGTTKQVQRFPRLRWRGVKGADYYNVQLFRGRRKVLSAWPQGTDLQLRSQWTFRGRRYVLSAGRYHWYAWPGFGRRSAHRYGRLISHRSFTFTPNPS